MNSSPIKKSILEPEQFVNYILGKKQSQLNGIQKAIICFDFEPFKKLTTLYKDKYLKGLSGDICITKKGFALSKPDGIGAPSAVAFIEELIACGLNTFITIGTAGKLHDGLEPGEIVLCEKAFIDEGTSKHYFEKTQHAFPSISLSKIIANQLDSQQVNFIYGKAWTTDAPYRETNEKLKYYLNKGADVVEMEASAMFNVARFRNVQMASLFIVSDSLVDGKWEPYFTRNFVKNKLVELTKSIIALFNENEF